MLRPTNWPSTVMVAAARGDEVWARPLKNRGTAHVPSQSDRQNAGAGHHHLRRCGPLIGCKSAVLHMRRAELAARANRRWVGEHAVACPLSSSRGSASAFLPTMLISLPPELAIPASLAGATNNPYLPSRLERQRPIFSPTTSSYTQHLFYARRPSKPTLAAAASMPRPNPPPTPGSSSDLRGKEGSHTAPTFHLPPTAFPEPDRASTSSATPSANGSDSSYRPVSPAQALEPSRKRPAPQEGPVITKDDFALPPPPTRSRKIIQMKPQANDAAESTPTGLSTSPQASRTQSGGQTGGKRKQNSNGTTAAGRKIARKTAHSLIERRRRSKMNEEFGVLKDMIPACKGQEMHKLAILQVCYC